MKRRKAERKERSAKIPKFRRPPRSNDRQDPKIQNPPPKDLVKGSVLCRHANIDGMQPALQKGALAVADEKDRVPRVRANGFQVALQVLRRCGQLRLKRPGCDLYIHR